MDSSPSRHQIIEWVAPSLRKLANHPPERHQPVRFAMSSRRTSRFSRHWRAVAALVLACTAWAADGCLPIPNTEQVTPALSGIIRSTGGAPISGVLLAVSAENQDDRCLKPVARATSDSSGHFDLPEVRRHHSWFLLVPFDIMYSYHLCAMEGDSGAKIYEWHSMDAPPRSETLTCTARLHPVPQTECHWR